MERLQEKNDTNVFWVRKMRADLRPYPRMRDSGVEWLGEVPQHWEVRRYKTVFRCVDERSETGSEKLLTVSSDRGIVPRDSTSVTMFKAHSYVGHKLCWPGDLVINSLWAWSRGLGVSRYHGIVSTAYGVYRVRRKARALPDFIHSLVRSQPFNWELRVRSKGIWISRLQLTDDSFLRSPLPLPPLSEQRAIVRFLDDSHRRIQRYIRAKERLIELLEEERQATIHEAVTGRIDVRTSQRYPAYKDSGVEWLGEVPVHWEVRRLSNVADLRVSNVDKHKRRNEQPIRLCNYVDVYKNDVIHGELQFMRATATDAEITKFRLAVGDVVVTKDSEDWTDIGVPALVEDTAEDLVCGYHLAILRPVGGLLHGPFLARVLRIAPAAWRFRVAARGVTRYGLTRDAIRSVEIPLPTLREQHVIAGSIDATANRLDAAIAATKRRIALLHECHTRLIADVVTGKLDVRDAAAELPSEGDLASDRDRIPATDDAEGRSACGETVS